MLSCWPNLIFFLSPTIFSFSAFHGLVAWGWGLRIESVSTVSRPFTADSILIIMIIIKKSERTISVMQNSGP